MKVYLDYAATSPLKSEVKKAMLPYLENEFGNPSSIHSWGQAARQGVDNARAKMAEFLNAKPEEIIFTSGGTESDNLAIFGIVNALNCKSEIRNPKSEINSKFKIQKPHIITTQIEHHAILKTCEHLEKNEEAEVTYLKPNREGLISVAQVQKEIKENTVLVSTVYVNNEIGTVQPIREIGKMIESENRKKNPSADGENSEQIYFHTDAVQATQYQPMDVDCLHVDLLTISAHKIGAAKGTGVLYVRKNTPMTKILFGGEQENNWRAGTENVAGIAALGKAIELITKDELQITKIKNLRDYFIEKILKEIPETQLNGSRELRSPNNANFYFKYIEGESILLSLDLAGIAASSGSACTSLSLQPSHVLVAVYDSPERAHGSIRFTLGETTTKKEIDYVVENLKTIVTRLRKISPLIERK